MCKQFLIFWYYNKINTVINSSNKNMLVKILLYHFIQYDMLEKPDAFLLDQPMNADDNIIKVSL